VLQKNDFLVDCRRVIKEVVVLDTLLGATEIILDSLDVTEVEKILADGHNLGTVVKEDAIGTIAHFVPKSILSAEINKLRHQFNSLLLISSCNQSVARYGVSNCLLYFC